MVRVLLRQAVCAVLLAGATGFSQDALTSISAVRALPPARAAKGLRVEVEVTATYVELQRENGLFVHDGEEGIYLKMPPEQAKSLVLEPGVRLRLHARTHEGDFIPRLSCESYERLGNGPLPKPVIVTDANLFSPSLDCQWVKVTGVIVGTEPVVDDQFVFVMQLYGWTVKLLLPVSDALARQAPKLMQRPVTFEGVAATVFNAQRQMTGRYFAIPSLQLIHLEGEAPQAAATLVAGVDHLLRSDATAENRVRLRGVVTYATKNELFLRGQGGSLRVLVADGGEFKPGDRVEVEGIAVITPFRPELRASQVTSLGKDPLPVPIPLSAEAKDLSSLPAELMEVEAEYLGRRDNPDAVVLQCRTGERFFEAFLPRIFPLPEGTEAGAKVRLVGICELTTTHPLPRTLWVDGFRLHLRNSADLIILTRPSWWTASRLLVVLALVAGLGMLSLAWGWTLRRQVIAQTEIIGAQIEREAILTERRRLARDFHDTLEQELTGVAIQLENAEARFESSPVKAREALQLARKMLRYSREEARTSISDLRSVLLDQGGLAEALRETLSPLTTEGAATATFKVTGSPWRMDAAAENHLLRMAREAVTNAARHSGAARIEVELAYDPQFVRLVITDDGRGFDVTARPPRGHFGLVGLQERASKIGAALKIHSAPKAGTRVSVTLSAERAKSQRPDPPNGL